MQISKKLYTTLIIAILTLSTIIAAIPMASAEITTVPILVTEGGTTAVTGGAVGTEIDVVGNSTSGAASPFSTVTVYLDALSGTVLGVGSADNTGSYTITVTIPPTTAGIHYIVVNDGETESTGTAFTVTPTISADVTKALPGDSVTVTGDGYAASDDIVLTLNSTTLGTPYNTTLTVVPETDSTGSFSVVFVVPTIAFANFDVYNLTGTDEASNNATTTLNIDYYITLTPAAGPTGITTTIDGRIKPTVAYTITFNGAPIAAGTTDASGAYANTYTIPGVLSPAAYQVQIRWETTNTRNATFTVTTPPTIALGTTTGIAGAVVTITGTGFSGSASITLTLGTTVVNSTAIDDRFGETTSGGTFSENFVVPALAPGIYAVSVVDQYGATSATGVFFTITATPVFTVMTRATEYMRMDFISVSSLVSTAVSVDLVFTDPTGLVWYTGTVTAGQWQQIGTYFQIPYSATSLTWWPITSDAPLGTWNFTCYAFGTTTVLDTNLFTVSAKANLQNVLDTLTGLEANMTALGIMGVNNITDAITTSQGVIVSDLNAINAKITTITSGVATIQTDVGNVYTIVSNLDITSLTADLATINAKIGTSTTTITTAISNLNAKVTTISGNVATVSTTLGTLQGIVTSIDGTTATIATDVGTIKADITAVQSDVAGVQSDVAGVQTDVTSLDDKVDTTPAWIAVALAAVAAIAAIFAVITIRQKIAG
jgi:hypothetical protein